MPRQLFVLFCISIFLSGCDKPQPISPQKQTIVFLRHGEKPQPPDSEHEQLSCQGLHRALGLPTVLQQKFGKPDYIFAPATTLAHTSVNPKFSYERSLTTILPTAIKLQMPVDVRFVYNDDQGIANALLTEMYHRSLIFVAWEHRNLVLITRNIMSLLNADSQLIPDWQDDDFDTLYVLEIDWSTNKPKVTFRKEKENLNTTLDTACFGPAPESTNPPDSKQYIYLLPAAEGDAFGQLNCQGLNRAIALAQYLTNSHLERWADYFFAPSPSASFAYTDGKNNFYFRGLMTLVPTVVSQNQPLFTLYGYKEIEAMKNHLLSETFHDKTLLVSWEISQLPALSKALMLATQGDVQSIPETMTDYDAIYKIVISHEGGKVSSQFSMDHQNISPTSLCPKENDDS